MKLTINKIRKYSPCGDFDDSDYGLQKGINSLKNKGLKLDHEFTLIDVLKSNGIKDAVWCLRCFDYLDTCLFAADIAESVLDIYEKYNNSKALCKLIQAIRDFKAGKITKNELKEFRRSSATAYSVSTAAAATAAAAVTAAAAADAPSVVYVSAVYAVYAADAADKKWNEIEKLFIKHFGVK